MTKKKLARIKRTLHSLPVAELITFEKWLLLLKENRLQALSILNEAERYLSQDSK